MISTPPGTEMFHFPGFRPAYLCIQYTVTRIKRAGLPHSEIAGSKCICHSPTLIAAYHVLHRLPVPRHPSCALSSLTTKVNFDEVAYSHAAARRANSTTPANTPLLQGVSTFSDLSIVKEQPRCFIAETAQENHGGRTRTRTWDLVLIRDAL